MLRKRGYMSEAVSSFEKKLEIHYGKPKRISAKEHLDSGVLEVLKGRSLLLFDDSKMLVAHSLENKPKTLATIATRIKHAMRMRYSGVTIRVYNLKGNKSVEEYIPPK